MIEKIIDILSEFTDVPRESINGDSKLFVDLGLSSLDVFGIISRLEEEFHINIDECEMVDFQTLNDVMTFINSASK